MGIIEISIVKRSGIKVREFLDMIKSIMLKYIEHCFKSQACIGKNVRILFVFFSKKTPQKGTPTYRIDRI